MIFKDEFKDFKSLYVCVSGGVDSALGLFLLAKHISENNLTTKITIVTAVEPQPYWGRNDKNAKKIVSIISDMFPNVNIENHLIHFLEGYVRNKKIEKKLFPKVKAMETMHKNNWKNEKYDLGISFQSSFPKLEELKKFPKLYAKSLSVGPEDRDWTGKKNDKINGSWWQPFVNLTKKDFENLYEKHNLMYSLFPYTASCTGDSLQTNNFTKPCRECFWCLEKYWAFEMFDYPEAYSL
tara:strand:+ start:937 stop:1650 length:714 start_codon:yes stop_codon:yes gene_type:complete